MNFPATLAVLEELSTLRDWLRWTVSQFNATKLHFGHGAANALDEAAWLLCAALHLPQDRLDVFLDAHLSNPERAALFELLRQRVVEKKPTAYLTHSAWLGEFHFYVDERVIIPRSYFAELLIEGFSPWIEDAESITAALDLCTGSGCLAVLMAHAFPAARIDAADISPDALDVARRNIADYALEQRVHLHESDLFAALDGSRFDLIISNPPYVTAAAMTALPAEYRHEPALALAAGADGLDVVRRIIAGAKNHLTPDGLIAIEVGHNRHLVDAAFPQLPITWIDTPSAEEKIFVLHAQDLPG